MVGVTIITAAAPGVHYIIVYVRQHLNLHPLSLFLQYHNHNNNNKHIEPFREPVDWENLGLFDYPQVIKKPMDLGMVKKKINEGKYKTIHEASDDVRMIWKNCMTYNADGSDFYNLAQVRKIIIVCVVLMI